MSTRKREGEGGEKKRVTKPPCVVTSQPQLTGFLTHYIRVSSLKPEKVDILVFLGLDL